MEPTEQPSAEQQLIHRVCEFLCEEIERGSDNICQCRRCPMTIDTPYGPGVNGCILRAQELIAIVKGNTP